MNLTKEAVTAILWMHKIKGNEEKSTLRDMPQRATGGVKGVQKAKPNMVSELHGRLQGNIGRDGGARNSAGV